MKAAQQRLEGASSAELSCARSAALLDQLSRERPVLFYGAPLLGDAVCLGAYQREDFVVGPAPAAHWMRRSSGGNAVYAGTGIFHFAIALHDASSLMDCPPGRILNRNVRGLLQGFRTLGVPAHYFGRDYVSMLSRPGAYIAWDEREDGRVLFEAFIACERSHVPDAARLAYPPRAQDPFRGHAPITLHEAAQRTIDDATLFEHLVRGYAATHQVDVQALEADVLRDWSAAADVVTPPRTQEPGLFWSLPYEEAIGFVYAGVRVADGALQQVQVGGDYFQSRAGQAAVQGQLRGCAIDGTLIGRAINDVYRDPRHVIEGLRHMDSLRAVILSAAEQASAHA